MTFGCIFKSFEKNVGTASDKKSRDSSADSSSLEVEDEVQVEVTVPSRGQIYPRNQTLTEVKNGLAWLAEPSQRKKLKAMEKKEGMGKIEIMKK